MISLSLFLYQAFMLPLIQLVLYITEGSLQLVNVTPQLVVVIVVVILVRTGAAVADIVNIDLETFFPHLSPTIFLVGNVGAGVGLFLPNTFPKTLSFFSSFLVGLSSLAQLSSSLSSNLTTLSALLLPNKHQSFQDSNQRRFVNTCPHPGRTVTKL